MLVSDIVIRFDVYTGTFGKQPNNEKIFRSIEIDKIQIGFIHKV